MSNKANACHTRCRTPKPVAYTEMRKSLSDLLILYRAARRAMRRHLLAGQSHVAARLAADASFIAKWIAALRAEMGAVRLSYA